ncbi:family 43 glycosylhydrolase [Rufibacter tibetensis]|uniref:family 43 glycosylhydrolase n=1 Tax=Rufibacter tibetensis TaxID=512763 RepID=UPI00090071C3|nr:family 43 glycosylhydrolase [Rufibacter tibetensis]
MRKNLYSLVAFWLLLLLAFPSRLFALDGNINSHDPGALLKDGKKYWMFTTGAGIYAAFSEDLIRWNSAPKTVFPIGTWPEWINKVVPGFEGIFWAPECVFMNGRYYLYYSCSTFGSSTSAIGVASSPTLDQDSPAYQWTDHGMVVSSSARTDINAIDPAIFKDDDGRVYMSYGSFSAGIGVVELDPLTGKRKVGAAIVTVAGGNNASWEAPYIFKEGPYYYLVVNRGFCCRGTSSTYYLVMGRSTSINGPYVDKAGVDLRNGGGTTLLNKSGKYIGPGHFGLMRENGYNYVSMHYYDGNDNGNAKLDIANLGFDATGWPFLTRDWVAAGRYKMTNQNSQLAWESKGCTGKSGEPLAQAPWTGLNCQQWDLTPVGDGVYTIRSAESGLALSLTPSTVPLTCNTAPGTKLQMTIPLDLDCQKFKIERAADGAYVFTSLANNLVVEVPFASREPGTELITWGQNGCACQRWYINRPSESIVSKASYTAPQNGRTVSYENLQLLWTGNAQSYNVYLGSSPNQLELVASNTSATSLRVPDQMPIGTYYWRVDAVTNGQVAVGEVWSFTVEDRVAPTVLVRNISVTLKDGMAMIQPQEIDAGSNDAYGIASVSLSKDRFDCSALGVNEVLLKVTDKNGNSASTTANVTVEGALPAPAISVSRRDPTFTGADANTLFLGYGAQELLLTASNLTPTGLTTYQWTPSEGLSSTHGAEITFKPTVAGTYRIRVTATNEFGCQTFAEMLVKVIDARCNTSLGKVLVCHKGAAVCVEASSVQEHLGHGCNLGNCTSTQVASSGQSQSALAEAGIASANLKAFPNPAYDHTTIEFSLPKAGKYKLALFDSNGKLVEALREGVAKSGESESVPLSTAKYAKGLYLLQLVTEQGVTSTRLVIH